jgi:hypothetical protein
MSQQRRASASDDEPPIKAMGDPWQAFGYVTSGVALYGFVGWLLDRWWGTSFMVAIGILAGAGLGIYMTFGRFGRPGKHDETQHDETQHDETPGTSGTGRTEE